MAFPEKCWCHKAKFRKVDFTENQFTDIYCRWEVLGRALVPV